VFGKAADGYADLSQEHTPRELPHSGFVQLQGGLFRSGPQPNFDFPPIFNSGLHFSLSVSTAETCDRRRLPL